MKIIQRTLLLLGFTLLPATAGPIQYSTTIDTSALLGQAGFVDLEFNPGQVPGADDTTAAIEFFHLSGGSLSGPAMVDGTVSGTLDPGPLYINNGTSFNAWFQPVLFGNDLNFLVSFSGPGIDTPTFGTVETDISVGLYTGTLDNLALAEGPLPIVIRTDGTVDVSGFSGAGVTITETPEPASWSLVLGAALLAGGVRSRKSISAPLHS